MSKKFLVLFFVLAGSFLASAANAQVTASNTTAGSFSNYTFNFSVSGTLDPAAAFSITFPSGFDASSVQIAGSSTMDGGFTNFTATQTTVTFQRDGTGTNATGNQSITIAIVKNPTTTGTTSAIQFSAVNSAGAGAGSGSTSGSVTITPAELGSFSLSGVPATATAGVAFNNVTVTAKDVYGNTKTDYSGTVTWSSIDAQASLPSDDGNGWSNGEKTFNGFVLKTAGNQTITVSDGDISKESSAIAVSAAAVNDFTLSNPGTQTAGVGFSLQITNAVDAYGNPVSGTATVAFADAGSHTAPNGDSPALSNITVTNGSGSATQVLPKAESGVQLKATLGAVSKTTTAFTVQPGPLNTFVLSGVPASATAGVAFNNVTVTAKDVYGNTKTDYSGTVTWSSADAQASLPSDDGTGWSNGAKTFNNFVLKTAGNQTITVSDGDISKESSAIAVSPAAVSDFTLSNPGSQVAGSSFALSITGAVDAYGNAVSGTATVTFADGGSHLSPSGDAPVLTNITVTNGSGVANQTLYNAESGVQLKATLGGVSKQTSAFIVNPADLSNYSLSSPGNQVAGTGFSLSISNAVDGYGNPVDGTAVVSFVGAGSHTSPDGYAPALQNIPVSNGAGSATQVLYKKETGVQLQTALGGISKQTALFDVSGASLDHVAVLNSASGNTSEVGSQTLSAGSTLTVHAGGFDAYGNYLGDESVTWSVTGGIGSVSPGSGVSTTFTAQTAGSGAITADHASATDGVSGTITVTTASLSYVKIVEGASGDGPELGSRTLKAGQTLTLHAAGYDASGNYLGDVSVDWSVSNGIGSFSVVSGASTVFTAEIVGSGTITADHASATDDVSGTITVEPGPLSSFVLSGVPSTATAGTAFGGVTVTAKDVYGNTKTDYSGTVTWSSTDVQADLPTDDGTGWSGGSKTFSGFNLKTAGSQTITVTDGSVSKRSGVISVSPAAVASFTLSDPGDQTAGVGFALSITSAQDAYGNAVSGTATVAFAAGGNHDAPRGDSPLLQNISVVNGSGSATQVLYKAESNVQLQATLGTVSQTTAAFDVVTSALDYVKIIAGTSGDGPEFGSATLSTGDTQDLHAGGYDRYGNYIDDQSVSWSVSGGIGTVSPASGESTTFSATKVGSGFVLADHATATDDQTGTITVTEGVLSYVKVVEGLTGDGPPVGARTLKAGQTLTVHAAGYDAFDNYLGDYVVTWTVSNGIGSFSVASGASTVFTAEKTGSGVITADHATATDGATGQITVQPGPLAYFTLTGVPASVVAGNTFPSDIVVTAYDAYGNLKTDYDGTVTWTSTDNGTGRVLPADATFSGATQTFSKSQFKLVTVGGQTITVTDATAGISRESSVINVLSAGLADFDVSVGTSQTAGVAFPIQVTNAVDSSGNPWSGTLNVQISSGGGNSPNGTAPATNPITVVSGSGSANQVLVNAVPTVFRVYLGTVEKLTPQIAVAPAGLNYVKVVAGNSGNGAELGEVSMHPGDTLTVHAAGYDAFGNYKNDENVSWSVSGGIGTVNPESGSSSTVFTATTVGSGYITADHATAEDDQAGPITVSPGNVAYIKIMTKAGGPAAGAIEFGDTVITADQSIHLYAAGFDAGDTYLGDFDADWSSSGLDPAVSATGTSHIVFSPKTAPASGTISASYSGATGDQTGTIQVVPGVPAGSISLWANPDVLPADQSSQSVIRSGVIRDADGNQVSAGTLITVSTTLGTIVTADASSQYEGIQVPVDSNGRISFVIRSSSTGGTAYITAASVEGSAVGNTTLQITNLRLLSVEAPDTVSQGQTGTPVTLTVQNLSNVPVTDVTANLTFTGPAPNYTNYNNDYGNRSVSLSSIPANSTVPIQFSVDVSASAHTGIPITIDAGVSGTVNSAPISAQGAEAKATWLVQTPARLAVTSVSADLDTVSQGQQNIVVRMRVRNLGQAGAQVSSAQLIFKKGATDVSNQYTATPDPTNPVLIPGDSTATFRFVVDVSAGADLGTIVLDGRISALDVNSQNATTDVGADTTDSWQVIEAAVLQITSLVVSQSTVTQGQDKDWIVWMNVRNNGGSAVRLDSANIYLFIGSEVTSEYTIVRPTAFWNNGFGSQTLGPHSQDKLRFVVAKTGVSLGLATIQGKLWVTDQVSGEQLFSQTDGNSASVTVQSPAQLQINFMTTSQPSVTAGQEKDWTVMVNIRNSGGSTITIDTSRAASFLTFKIGITDVSDSFQVVQPAALVPDGGLELEGGKTSNLIFTITKTGNVPGYCVIHANITARENNSDRLVTDNTSDFGWIGIPIETSPAVYIQSTLNKAPNAPDVNTGQTFQIEVTVFNGGGDGVHNVDVVLESDGQSAFNSPQRINRIASGGSAVATFQVTASDAAGTIETFTARISSALADNTNEPAPIAQALDSTATAHIERPAGLDVVDVFPSDPVVSAGQAVPNTWSIYVVVKDTGQASLTLDAFSANDITFRRNGQLQTDYIVAAPQELRGGGRNLEGGEVDTLIYVVNTTGHLAGDVEITATITGKDDNSGFALSSSDTTHVEVQTSATVQIISTIVDAPKLLAESNAEVDTRQQFQVKTFVENKGNEAVEEVQVHLFSDGHSVRMDSVVVIPNIPPGQIREAAFRVQADSVENLNGETFVVRIEGATSSVSQLPAFIRTAIDSVAKIYIESPAKAKLLVSTNDRDNILSVHQELVVTASVANLGHAALVGTGQIEFRIPPDYLLLEGADTLAVALDTVSISASAPVQWTLLTPSTNHGPDTLVVRWLSPLTDENTAKPAELAAPADSVIVQTLVPNILASQSEIFSPRGARDGVLSTEQEFWVRTILVASPNLVTRHARLRLPDGYVPLSQLSQDVVNDTVQWKIRAPEHADQGWKELIISTYAEDEFGTRFYGKPDTLQVETIRRANLSLQSFISEPEGAKDGDLSVGQPFTIRAIVSNLGQAAVYGPAYVRLDLGATGVRVEEDLVRPFTFQEGSLAPIPVDWHAFAPDTVSPPALISVVIDTVPYDENSDRVAFVSVGQVQFTVATEKAAQIQNDLSIVSPEGAVDGVLSTGQEFTVEAKVQSQNAVDIRAELVLPPGFSTENRVKSAQSGYDVVSWMVKAPPAAQNGKVIKVITRATDANNTVQQVVSEPDSVVVDVVSRAALSLTASITDPPEARNGILSVEEQFVVTATVQREGQAGLLDEAQLRLFLPEGFTSLDDTLQMTAGLTASWRVVAPSQATLQPRTIKVLLTGVPRDENTNEPAEVKVSLANIAVSVESKRLEVGGISGFTKASLARGEKNVPLFGFLLKNRGVEGSNKIRVTGLTVYLVDRNGKPLDPGGIFSSLTVRNNVDTSVVYGRVSQFGNGNAIVISFEKDLVLSPGVLANVGIYGDILGNATTTAFQFLFREVSDIQAVDAVTGKPVILVDQSGAPVSDLADIQSSVAVVLDANFEATFGNYPNPFGKPDRLVTKFVYYLDKDMGGELRIYTLVGDLVWKRSFTAGSRLGTRGLHDGDITWNGTNMHGMKVLNGVYVAVLTTEDGKKVITKVAVVK